ncbi:ABC transporter permease [Actinomadura rudentiformis]|uniref:Transport permease protein n=1 Tax=Actinomadura rudentiformis TaxID=359158 RepID=A0A6H9Z2N9_9ACTN|nr:ABC transporter permease [Actinomadura rudentiformis]KAB2349802.1 ABC transporter permease [Actinomadura rudentiformis]
MITEAKLLLREPITLFWSAAFPVILLIVMGLASSATQADLGGLRLIDTYQPILIAFAATAFAVQGMPTALATYRERRILRRLATTPVGPARVLAAQLTANLALILTATAAIITTGHLAFHVPLPGNGLAFLLALMLTATAMLSLGLLVAALAPSGRAAGAIGAVLFFPMMFFAGLWIPKATMPHVLRQISDFTPLGAAVQALQDSTTGQWPAPVALAMLTAYAIIFAAAAAKFFRWQ